ncbi:MAG: MATE family efflux transporter [Verrucomicrobia bacterium]|nr:MATE family efflux transporter [Verrucomicrobiota bacterium]
MARPPYLAELRPTLTLAAPIVIGQVSQMLMGVTDSAMIGHAGTVPLAASAFGSNIFNIFYVFGIGLMIPVSIFVARARGAQRPEEAAEYLRHGLTAALVAGAAEMLVMAALATQLHRFGQPPEVLAIVTPFYLLFAASIAPVLVYLVLRQYAEAMGHPWVPMFIMLGGVGLNALLNWVFIYGHLGVPALGLTGAGISTLTSRTLGALVIFLWLRRYPAVRESWPRHWWGGYSAARFREMLHVGAPAGGMLLFEVTAFAFSGIMIGWLGAVPLAAHQIAMTCASFAFMFPLGLSTAAGMRVSHAVGAGERGRLRPIAFGAIGLGLAVMTFFAVAFAVGGRMIASWFVPDPAVIALAAQLLIVAAVFQLADGVQVIAAAVLRGVTDVRLPAVITLIAYWVIALPLGYGLGISGPLGAAGVWVGIAGGLAFAAIFLTVRFARLTR